MKLPYQIRLYRDVSKHPEDEERVYIVENIHTGKIAGWFGEAENMPLRQAALLRNRLNTKIVSWFGGLDE